MVSWTAAVKSVPALNGRVPPAEGFKALIWVSILERVVNGPYDVAVDENATI
jgi:hypothetical protein